MKEWTEPRALYERCEEMRRAVLHEYHVLLAACPHLDQESVDTVHKKVMNEWRLYAELLKEAEHHSNHLEK
ncbi:hypothetical protein A374_14045 [Fictibacillus macauensis ZFHKF-1]|uniref:Uncharacterized protein n=1 Tax=Fictibacillus macauensis ZFHKF-1 TaxID=1196324 RepID=I8AHA4_9BACL|nr:hypothetical protein [Fictibacillus macauensis]EIT84819.1 hypothetical protein A374_14045 [Fictibacillus macauensis ZFHKF-1]